MGTGPTNGHQSRASLRVIDERIIANALIETGNMAAVNPRCVANRQSGSKLEK